MVDYTWGDTNLQNGPPQGYCGWDPGWGAVPSTSVPTRTQSNWTDGADLDSSGTTDFDIHPMDFIFRMLMFYIAVLRRRDLEPGPS